MPTADFVDRFYSTGIYRGLYKGFLKANKEFVIINRSFEQARERIDFIAPNAKITLPGNAHVLDFGCSEGTFLKELKKKKPEFVVYGVEPGINFSIFNKKSIDGLYENIDDIPSGVLFDLVTMFHVLEHCRDPLDVLSKLWGKLKKNGSIIIEVPDLNGYLESARNFHIGHLYYFSKDTIRKIVEAAGFTLVEISSPERNNMRIIARK